MDTNSAKINNNNINNEDSHNNNNVHSIKHICSSNIPKIERKADHKTKQQSKIGVSEEMSGTASMIYHQFNYIARVAPEVVVLETAVQQPNGQAEGTKAQMTIERNG